MGFPTPRVTVCVLTYGDYPRLAKRVVESIRRHFPRSEHQLVVGANAVGDETLAYLESVKKAAALDHLMVSPANLYKCPMMRRMFAGIQTEFIWWFDDDSYVEEPTAFPKWLEAARAAPESVVMWGQSAHCDNPESFTSLEDAVGFVRSATWYRGLPPPSWRLGGKGEFNFENRGKGDGRWLFILGGCWLIRTRTIRALNWPDPRLKDDDVFLGEAIRQNGWNLANIGTPGVALNTEPRRGNMRQADAPRLK